MSTSDFKSADNGSTISRRSLIRSFAAIGTIAAAPQFASAANVLTGAGDIRKIHLQNQRTGEILDMIYWIEGKYVKESMTEINGFFRDWRQNSVKTIDPHAIDIIAATHRMLNTSEPYLLISGYRTPRTNSSLRGAAKNSYHTRGMAADLRLKSRSVKQMSGAARAVNSGGVGTYYGSNFVHMDSGPVRTWRG